jgi:hypothetical protein
VNKVAEAAERFELSGRRYCLIIDSAALSGRTEFLLEIYRVLPVLIDAALSLPKVELKGCKRDSDESKCRMTHEDWQKLYESLQQKLNGWDFYHKVFDPTTGDTEAIFGSLADDLADIYRDVQEGLLLRGIRHASWEAVVSDWRFSFYSHWGKHAIDALDVIHARLSESLM